MSPTEAQNELRRAMRETYPDRVVRYGYYDGRGGRDEALVWAACREADHYAYVVATDGTVAADAVASVVSNIRAGVIE